MNLRATLRSLSTLQLALGASFAVHAALLTVRFVDPARFDRVFQDTPLEVILVNARTDDKPQRAQASAQAASDLDRLVEWMTGSFSSAAQAARTAGAPRDLSYFDVRLHMTPAGEKLAALMPEIASRVLNHHLRGFSRDELELLKSLLRRIIANADG